MGLKKKVGSVFIIMGIAAVCEFLTTMLLGRNLSPDIFGRFKFIHTIILMFSSLLLLGQNSTIIRVVGKHGFDRYDWKKLALIGFVFAGSIAIFVIYGLGYFFDFEGIKGLIYIALIAAIGIEFNSASLRAHNQCNKSIFIAKLPSLFFCVVVFFLIKFLHIYNFKALLNCYSFVFLSAFIIGAYYVNQLDSGKDSIPLSSMTDGLWLFLQGLSFTMMMQIDQFFIVKLLDYEHLAGYVAVIATTRGFELLAIAIWFVLMPHYSRNQSGSILMYSVKAAGVGICMVGIYMVIGEGFLDFVFKGKFDHVGFLFKYFIPIGFLRVLYAVPSSIIDGRISSHFLKIFVICSLLGILINVIGNIILIPRWGLSGAAFSTLLSWVFRVVIAYSIVYKEKLANKKIGMVFN